MGRGKIEIKKIENVNSRQVTFSKRRAGLFKKASELAILCDADIAVIIFSNTGKLFEFASSSMKKILSRYKNLVDSPASAEEEEPIRLNQQSAEEANALRDELEQLKLSQLRMMGKDFTGMNLQELGALEQQLNEGLLCIKERKEQVLMQELSESRMQEQRAALENETLRRQVEQLQAFVPINISSPTRIRVEYNATVKSDPAVNEGSKNPESSSNGALAGAADELSDTTLQLGLPTVACRKRKTSDGETHSSTSDTEMRLG